MFKLSDCFLLLAVLISFVISGYFLFNEDYIEAVFTAVWVPSILAFGIYFKVLGISAVLKDSKNNCCCCCNSTKCSKDKDHEKSNDVN